MQREPYYLLHFMDSVFHNQKGSWKARTQRCRHKIPRTRITQIKQIAMQSPFEGDPCKLIKCKASLCHTVESKEISVRGHWIPFANLQLHQSGAGPKIIVRPQESGWSIANAAVPLLWWVLALCRGQHTDCSGTDTNISWLCSTVPCHTLPVRWADLLQAIYWNLIWPIPLWSPSINPWTKSFCVAEWTPHLHPLPK